MHRVHRSTGARLSLFLAVALSPGSIEAQESGWAVGLSLGAGRQNIGGQLGGSSAVGADLAFKRDRAWLRLKGTWSYAPHADAACIELIVQDCGPGAFPHLGQVSMVVGGYVRSGYVFGGIHYLFGDGNPSAGDKNLWRPGVGAGLRLRERVALETEYLVPTRWNRRTFQMVTVSVRLSTAGP